MIFALFIPTLTVLAGILVNQNGQNAIRADLSSIRDKVGTLGERVAKLEAK